MTDFAIPGLQSPQGAPKFDERVFTDLHGSLNIPVYGPVPSGDPAPSFVTNIYDVYSHQVTKLVFEDGKGLNIIRNELQDGLVEYRLFINYKDIIENADLHLPRGSYKLDVCANDRLVKELWVVIKDHPKFHMKKPEDLEYEALVGQLPQGSLICAFSYEQFKMDGVLLSS